jgi:[acyl-carrier-protein] S-malonyltransferase
MTYAFIFPGQGSQTLGMGKALAESYAPAREVFEQVNDALSQDLTAIMWGEDADALNMTENTQPALMAVSVAVTRVLESQGGFKAADKGAYVAGHSLGEYSALTAVNTLELSTCAKLLKLRGQAMQRAVPVGQGAMAAILGLSFDEVEALTKDAGCELANDNSDGQVVVSGHKDAVEKACAMATEKGAKRAIMLPVSAPFHCALMQPAADEMKGALAEAQFNAPTLPVITNVTADAQNNPDMLRDLLVDQITGRVRWRESVGVMGDLGVTNMVELGAGKVLSGLVRRINKDITCANAETPEDIEKLLEILG